MCKNYCSQNEEDAAFGSIGTWESCEESIEGGGANPPFHTQADVCAAFEEGVLRDAPYCRCALMSLSSGGGVQENVTDSLSASSRLLVSFPRGAMPFRSQSALLSTRQTRPQAFSYVSVGLLIWVNVAYIKKHPPPRDIEAAYMQWATNATSLPSGSRICFSMHSKVYSLWSCDLKISSLCSFYRQQNMW